MHNKTTKAAEKLRQRNEISWKTFRGLTRDPTFLPPSLPPKSVLVDYAQFPERVSNDEASTRFGAFLFAKNIPSTQDPDLLLLSYAHKLSAPPLWTPEYATALSNYLLPTFRSGWDKHYLHEVKSAILSTGKTVEGIQAAEWTLSIEEFHGYCTGSIPLPCEAFVEIHKHKLIAIPDNGKYRLVTLGSLWQHLLAPLHRTIYAVLTSRGPTLRGSPLPSHFAGFAAETGPICSGDYVSSTDNLSAQHARHILSDLRSRSTHVPDQIWELALASLTGTLSFTLKDGRTMCREQNTGQLMGNYLSFPLLCISNIATLFLAFGSTEAWRLIYKKLVVINGDDIVWRAPSREAIDHWVACLPKSGFVINSVKTGVHATLFTLNSKLFRCGPVHVKKIWHLMPKGVFKKVDIRKETDVMAAHLATVRENVKNCPGKMRAKVTRALASVKKSSFKYTNVKTLATLSLREYEALPKALKIAERIKMWESTYTPLKETFKGKKLEKVEKEYATASEIAESPYVAAEARFTKELRQVVHETNNRRLNKWDWSMATVHMCQLTPRYHKKKEKEWIWVRVAPEVGRDSELEFEKFREPFH